MLNLFKACEPLLLCISVLKKLTRLRMLFSTQRAQGHRVAQRIYFFFAPGFASPGHAKYLKMGNSTGLFFTSFWSR
jgi:hypothetical protein